MSLYHKRNNGYPLTTMAYPLTTKGVCTQRVVCTLPCDHSVGLDEAAAHESETYFAIVNKSKDFFFFFFLEIITKKIYFKKKKKKK